jgi:hypothetical protein
LGLAVAGTAAFLVHGLVSAGARGPADHPAAAGSTPVASTAAATASSSAAAASSSVVAHSAQAVHSQIGVSTAAAQLTAVSAGQPSGAVSVAATNLSTGASYSWGAASGMVTASVVKLDTLETLLLQHIQKGTPLSSSEDSLAESMIENSDNDAADELWGDIGSDPAVTAANKIFGLTSTVVGTDYYWGLTTTSAADQVLLLRQLVGKTALDAASQAYALGLMRDVEDDQDWGVSAVADANTQTALKNGWLAVSDDDSLWTVNSVGLVTVHGQTIALAVMTQHQPDEATGIALVERLAAATVPAVQ